MEIVRAQSGDAALLAALRIEFLEEEHPIPFTTRHTLEMALEGYFAAHIDADDGDFVALLGRVGEEVVSTVFILLQQYPPNGLLLEPTRATALNVYTRPDHRHRGYARQLMDEAARVAEERGARSIDLLATSQGKGLYEKCGYTPRVETPMRLTLP